MALRDPHDTGAACSHGFEALFLSAIKFPRKGSCIRGIGIEQTFGLAPTNAVRCRSFILTRQNSTPV